MLAVSIFLISLLAFPMSYVVNTAQSLHGEIGLLVSGVVSLVVICLLTYLAVRQQDELPNDWLFYVFTLCTFSAVIDLIFALEVDGILRGFMSEYLERGELYFRTPHGIMILYWDGTMHFVLYLTMLVAMSRKKDFREVGLYWVGSIGHSMLVLLPGAIVGKFGVRWAFLLNIPYLFIPFLSGARFLRERPVAGDTIKEIRRSRAPWKRPVDALLSIALIGLTAIALFRGLAVLGWKIDFAVEYVKQFEPYLNDPIAFPKVQMMVYFFYFVPFYVMAIYGLFVGDTPWLSDWSLLCAGASAQAQVPYIFGALDHRTDAEFLIPNVGSVRIVFFCVNLAVLVVPHLLALNCLCNARRSDDVNDDQQGHRKKE